MQGKSWKMVALVSVVLMAPALALAKDNVGGGGDGGCQACRSNLLTEDAWCVAYGTGYSNLFGMTKCADGTEVRPFHVVATCTLSGSSCMGGLRIPIFPAYL